MCNNSFIVTSAYVCLLLAVLACALSYVAPFWIRYPDATASLFGFGTLFVGGSVPWADGLWASCAHDKETAHCTWYWENDFSIEKRVPDWLKATQGLFGGGLIFLIIAFWLSTFHICCRCCKESFSIGSAIGSFIITGTICIGVGIGVYGGFMYKDHNVGFDSDHTMFFWGFYVGIGGAFLALVSGILFFIQGCCNRNYTGYHMTRVV